jgi:putative transcriptional regulator
MPDFLDLDPQSRLTAERGRLLVSEPFLQDPYFRRTVVLLCEHNAEGSFGFVLNRRMEIGVNDLVEGLPPIGSPVGIGGPVQSSDLFYLHTLGAHLQGSEEVVSGVRMGGDFEQLRAMLAADPKLSRHVRFFVGYSGWGPGQLLREMEERSWLVARADRRSVMGGDTDHLWKRILRSMGREFEPLANFPEDPSLN